MVVISPTVPAQTLAEFVALARANPDKFNCATPPIGTTPQIQLEVLKIRVKLPKLENVVYKGGGDAIQALLSGTAHLSSGAVPPAAPQVTEVAVMPPAQAVGKTAHHLILQVNSSEPAMMNLALNNATNVEQYYKSLGEKVEIEVVTFGPGLHMLRDDTSPVKDRIKAIADKTPSISFKACGNTQDNMHKAEHKDIPLVAQATLVKSGVVRVMELQEQGWTYVRP